MIKQILTASLILVSCFSSGCTMERASDLDEEIAKLQQEITRLHQLKAELAHLHGEISKIRAAVVEAEEKKQKFIADNPKLEEFYKREIAPNR